MTMTTTRKTVLLGYGSLMALGLLCGASTVAGAQQNDGSDPAEARAFMAAQGSLPDSITSAEAKTGGKAISAEFVGDAADAGKYHVEVVMPGGAMSTVVVDPADGSVKALAAAEGEDRADGTEAGEGAETGEDSDGN